MSEEKRVKLVYVAGRYSASSDRTVAENVEAARAVARVVATYPLLFPVVPHQLNAGLEDVGDYEWWLAGTLELMRRCDAVVMVPGWEGSRGACAEREEAHRLGLPVFDAESTGCAEALRDFVTKPCSAPVIQVKVGDRVEVGAGVRSSVTGAPITPGEYCVTEVWGDGDIAIDDEGEHVICASKVRCIAQSADA